MACCWRWACTPGPCPLFLLVHPEVQQILNDMLLPYSTQVYGNTQLRTEPMKPWVTMTPPVVSSDSLSQHKATDTTYSTSELGLPHTWHPKLQWVSVLIYERIRDWVFSWISDIGWNYEFLICPPVSNHDLQDRPLLFGKHLHCTLGRLIIWRAELSLFHSFPCLLYNNSLPPLLQKRSHLISGQFNWAAVCSDAWADSRKWEDDTLGCWGAV